MRRLVPLALIALLAACPSYDPTPYLSSQDGLMNADEWAKYGPQQAIAVAVGRKFADAKPAAAVEYAKTFPQVASVEADSLGNRLVLTFSNNWTAQVTPITDGKSADETPGLPKRNGT